MTVPDGFIVEQDRTLSDAVSLSSCCPKFDLLAIVAGQRDLSVYRPLNFQKVFSAVIEQPVTCISWSSNGRIVIVGLADGTVLLLNVEDGSVLFRRERTEQSSSKAAKVTVLQWISLKAEGSDTPFTDIRADSAKFQGVASDFAAQYGGTTSVVRFLGSTELELLVVGYEDGVMDIYSSAYLLLKRVVFDKKFEPCQASFVGTTLHAISASGSVAQIRSIDCSPLVQSAKDLSMITLVSMNMRCAFDVLKVSFVHITKAWNEFLSLFYNIIEQFPAIAESNLSAETLQVGFLEVLASGVLSPALQLFVSQNIGTAALTRVQRSLDQISQNIALLQDTFVAPSLEMLSASARQLKSYMMWKSRAVVKHFSRTNAEALLQWVVQIESRVKDTGKAFQEAKSSFSLFLTWIGYLHQLLDNEDNIEEELHDKFADSLVASRLLGFLETYFEPDRQSLLDVFAVSELSSVTCIDNASSYNSIFAFFSSSFGDSLVDSFNQNLNFPLATIVSTSTLSVPQTGINSTLASVFFTVDAQGYACVIRFVSEGAFGCLIRLDDDAFVATFCDTYIDESLLVVSRNREDMETFVVSVLDCAACKFVPLKDMPISYARVLQSRCPPKKMEHARPISVTGMSCSAGRQLLSLVSEKRIILFSITTDVEEDGEEEEE
eukprot:ANDGO_02056.mRNA.1 hypothetical protein AMSG_05595